MNRERLYKITAIVLRRTDFGEADRLLTVYSLEEGKLRLLAKGVRKPTSRKAGHLELFTHVRLLVARGRELDLITQAEALEYFRALREDLVRTGYAHYIAELADGFMAEQDKNPAVFHLLLDTFRRLEAGQEAWPILRFFELRFLTLAGYRPELFVCVKCREPLKASINYFSPADGGALCPRCGEGKDGTMTLSPGALRVMRFFLTREYEVCQLLRVPGNINLEVTALLRRYLIYHLEKPLKSTRFLERLEVENIA
ncbi:MAG: DNA repair protein RecO [Anaerolineae bacterium]|nr:DNA repair protein RecO [Anaerolineae bacterium]MDW8102569.1 DNA repair protein RecO [Anaerolineae bacterium]